MTWYYSNSNKKQEKKSFNLKNLNNNFCFFFKCQSNYLKVNDMNFMLKISNISFSSLHCTRFIHIIKRKLYNNQLNSYHRDFKLFSLKSPILILFDQKSLIRRNHISIRRTVNEILSRTSIFKAIYNRNLNIIYDKWSENQQIYKNISFNE
jgi:hypothetical protein